MAVTTIDTTDTFDEWRVKCNTISTELGNLSLLTTTETSSLVGAINELDIVASNVGDTAPLGTTVSLAVATNTSDISSNASDILALQNSIDTLNDHGNSGALVSMDADTYNSYLVTVDQATVEWSFTSMAVGRHFYLAIISGSTGTSHTWDSNIIWPSATEPTLSADYDLIHFFKVSSTIILGQMIGTGFSAV